MSFPRSSLVRERCAPPPDAPHEITAATSGTAYGGLVTASGQPCRVVVAAALTGLLLAGCTDVPTSPSHPSARPDTRTSTATPSEPGPADVPSAGTVRLPWPVPDAASAATLQAEVDRGAQPWLLDPSEVAIAYAATAHGWVDAEAYPGPDGTSVDVRNAKGDRLTLTLAQPARAGDDGIWVVTAER
jgi:hypothetical protein